MSGPGAWSPERLADCPREPLGEPSWLKPAVWRVAGPDGPLVVKDICGLPRLTRWFGRYLLRRHAEGPGREGFDDAKARVEEALLFIEAAHACDARTSALAPAGPVAEELEQPSARNRIPRPP